MSSPRFATREPQAPARAGKVRRGLMAAIVAASFAIGVFAPLAGAAPVASSRIHPTPGCPGVQIGC